MTTQTITPNVIPLNPYSVVAAALAEDIVEVISNDRVAYEAVTGDLSRINDQVHDGDVGEYGELVRELLVRLFRRSGIDPDQCVTLLDTLVDRLLSLVDWRTVGERFTNH